MNGNNAFVAGVGSTNIDLLYSALPKLPAEGEEVYSQAFSLQLGGGIPATLMHLGRLGIPTKLATELGDDLFSSYAKTQYAQNGVTPVNLYSGQAMPLNVSTAMITANDRTFVSYGHGNPHATPETLDAALNLCRGAKIVLMQTGEFLPVYQQLKAEGAILVFDCGWDEAMSIEHYLPYLQLADYYTPNQKEACKITGTATPQEAANVLSTYFEHVLVKLDKDGCLGSVRGELFQIPPVSQGAAIDSTGAGDAFLAGFVYGLFHEYAFADCLLLGNLTGGKCVTEVGCLAASLNEAELLKLYRANRHKA